jgi:hypothetical protein
MAYKAKVWDGSEWVDIAAQPADLNNYATTDDLLNISGDSDQFIIPIQVFR